MTEEEALQMFHALTEEEKIKLIEMIEDLIQNRKRAESLQDGESE